MSIPLAVGSPSEVESTIIGSIVFISLLVAGLSSAARGRGLGTTLVLRRFSIDQTGSGGAVVSVVGRKPGLIAWLLTAMGFDAETSFTVGSEAVVFRTASLFGQVHQLVPMPNVSSTHGGYSKPLGLLLVGVIFAIVGLAMGVAGETVAMAIGIVLGVALIAIYFLKKTMTMSIETVGGMVLGLRFKASIIEGVPVDISRVMLAMRLINQRVLMAHGQAVEIEL